MTFRRFAASLAPAAMVGGFFLMAVGRANDPELSRLGLLFLGGLFGVAISGLIRLFRLAPWGLPWAGIFCGLVPAGLFFNTDGTAEDRGSFLVICALMGFVLGLIEWARVRAVKPPGEAGDGSRGESLAESSGGSGGELL